MRTKILLTAAAAMVAGLVSSSAQVYSANVVGYVNLTLTNGFNLVANQMDLDGTGTNNTLQTSFGAQLPNLTKVYVFSAGSYQSASYASGSGKWAGQTNLANAALKPGGGVFVDIPASTTTPLTVTLVGNVLQGNLSQNILAGYTVASSQVPISGLIDTNLGYVPSKGDKIYTYNSGSQSFPGASSYNGTKWAGNGGDQNLAIGQAVFVAAASNTVWQTNFVVH